MKIIAFILSLGLVAAGLTQRPQPEMLAHPKLPFEDYVIPPLGGQREIVMGMKDLQTNFYGYYAEYPQTRNLIRGSNMRISNPEYYVDEQVGSMSWSVATYPHDGQQAYLLQSESTYKQALPLKPHDNITFVNKARIAYWVSLSGKLLQINSVISVSAGNWILEADFHKDSYDLYIKNPVVGEQRSTLYPKDGTAAFDAMFAPMLKDGKEVVHEKTFATLNPVTGAPVVMTATLGGTWAGKLFNEGHYGGRYVDLWSGAKRERIYLSNDGTLYRVDEPGRHYISIEEVPSIPPSTDK